MAESLGHAVYQLGAALWGVENAPASRTQVQTLMEAATLLARAAHPNTDKRAARELRRDARGMIRRVLEEVEEQIIVGVD
jgi:hypothetical protein